MVKDGRKERVLLFEVLEQAIDRNASLCAALSKFDADPLIAQAIRGMVEVNETFRTLQEKDTGYLWAFSQGGISEKVPCHRVQFSQFHPHAQPIFVGRASLFHASCLDSALLSRFSTFNETTQRYHEPHANDYDTITPRHPAPTTRHAGTKTAPKPSGVRTFTRTSHSRQKRTSTTVATETEPLFPDAINFQTPPDITAQSAQIFKLSPANANRT